MTKIYTISDVHGNIDALNNALSLVDLSDNNQLIFNGDYIDRGKNSLAVLTRIMSLQKNNPKQIKVLMGNHEDMFLNWLRTVGEDATWRFNDSQLISLDTFIENIDNKFDIFQNDEGTLYSQKTGNILTSQVIEFIIANHKDVINWLAKLDYFYETDDQIFVHAGINEELNDAWRITDKHTMVWKYPESIGKFEKDIVSGHIHTSEISERHGLIVDNDPLLTDGQSHYFTDSNTNLHNHINVLCYDNERKEYFDAETGNRITSLF